MHCRSGSCGSTPTKLTKGKGAEGGRGAELRTVTGEKGHPGQNEREKERRRESEKDKGKERGKERERLGV